MSLREFYKLEQQTLLIEAEKIQLFTKHNPSIGSYREALLRAYIKKLLPRSVQVKSGFVSKNTDRDNLSDSQSRQVDVLIYDDSTYVSMLETSDYSVVRPESVLGCIEVKSTLTFYKKSRPNKLKETNEEYPFEGLDSAYCWAGTLVDALKNIKSTADVCELKSTAFYRGVFAYSADFDPINLHNALDSRQLQEQLDLKHLKELPMYICVIGKFLINFSFRDMFEPYSEHGYEFYHDVYESYCNQISVSEDDTQYPLQFFSSLLHNQICYLHSGKKPDQQGMFSTGGASIKRMTTHFELPSDDI